MGFWIYGRIPFTPIRYTGRIGLPKRGPTNPELGWGIGIGLGLLGLLGLELVATHLPTWGIVLMAFSVVALFLYLTVVRPIMKAPYVRDLEQRGDDGPAAHSDRR